MQFNRMWGLYSKGGVAIKTSIGALKEAIPVGTEKPVIHVGSVKYINFSDASLKPSDCVSDDGHLTGMIKRVAYKHEQEVRMYITREREKGSLELQAPASTRIPVDIEKLLEQVVISPFAGELINRSVGAICKWGGVSDRIIAKSKLLENCEYLLDVYK